MKTLPDPINLSAIMFGDGAKGMRLQVHANEEFGITRTASTAGHGEPWEIVWTADKFPNQEFSNYKEFQKAWNA